MAIATTAVATGRAMEAALPPERDCLITRALGLVRATELAG
jgi:hypothetical protein